MDESGISSEFQFQSEIIRPNGILNDRCKSLKIVWIKQGLKRKNPIKEKNPYQFQAILKI